MANTQMPLETWSMPCIAALYSGIDFTHQETPFLEIRRFKQWDDKSVPESSPPRRLRHGISHFTDTPDITVMILFYFAGNI